MTISPAYIPDPSQTDQQAAIRATLYGVGIAPRVVPPVYAQAVFKTPGVVAEYGGNVVFIHDAGTAVPPTAVSTLLAPLAAKQAADIAAQQVAVQQAAVAQTNYELTVQVVQLQAVFDNLLAMLPLTPQQIATVQGVENTVPAQFAGASIAGWV